MMDLHGNIKQHDTIGDASYDGQAYIPYLLVKSSVPPVSEPSTLAIFTLGLLGLALRRFKK